LATIKKSAGSAGLGRPDPPLEPLDAEVVVHAAVDE
jgi:hypothetical protein